MNFANVKALKVPEGYVNRIIIGGVVMWKTGILNMVPLSIDTDRSIYNNGLGYANNLRLSSSGETKTYDKSVVTGFIPSKGGSVVRVGSVGWRHTAMNYLCAYDADFNFIGGVIPGGTVYGTKIHSSITNDTTNDISIITLLALDKIAYIRISSVGDNSGADGSKMVVTINEEIADTPGVVSYLVTNTLTNCITSNSAEYAEEGSGYTATITADSGYELTSVKVVMGGADITASVYSDGIIDISAVTGDIVITANATVPAAYTNLVPLSINADGTIYNGIGYKSGYRLNSSGIEKEHAGACVTGYIPCTKGGILRTLGNTGASVGTTGNYVACYDENFNVLISQVMNYIAANESYWSYEDPDGDGLFLYALDTGNTGYADATTELFPAATKYIRISHGNCDGANLIVTFDEEIA